MKAEEYILAVNQSGIWILGGSPAAVSWGQSTMLQIMCYNFQNRVALPTLTVHDWPDVEYRSLMVDVARALVPSDDLYRAVDYCRQYKINVLHLHLGDDHAWTFPSDTWPQLGNNNTGFMSPCPYVYTKAELQAVVAYADARGVQIVPELEGPGHSGAMRRSVPSFSGGSTVNVVSDQFYKDYKQLMSEIASVFNNTKFFHIGCDETSASGFVSIPGYAAFIAAHNISGPSDVFAYYVKTLAGFAEELGRTPILWTGGDVSRLDPKEAIIMVWEGGSQAYIDQGFRVINSPGMGGPWPGTTDVTMRSNMMHEYYRNLTDFGAGDIAHTNASTDGLILGSTALLWETGFARGAKCYYGVEANPCYTFLDIVAAKASGQLWWGRTPPAQRPSNETFWHNFQASWGNLGRLQGLRGDGEHCEGPNPLHSCVAAADLADEDGELPEWYSRSRTSSRAAPSL